MAQQLDGRVAVVTGAGRGIGAGIAEKLASEGAAVAVVDLDESTCAETVRRITDAGGSALAVSADVTDSDSVERAFTRVSEQLGTVGVLVNNAGVTKDNMLFKMSEQDWDTVMGVHLRGAFLCSKAAQQQMVPQRWGKIVNLSSVSALGNRGQANYSTAKAGVQGFTKTLAIELGPFGINVNAIAPGFIVSDMTATTAERLGMTFEQLQEGAAAETPVRRVGQPADIANAVSFLTSEQSSFVTGQTLYVDGGRKLG
ncbi:3-oxoacyl-[acyl-carrier protein] reductase [Actinopolyspora lacussalsi]|uniref:3-oxoacyl-[acyl-carrier protein] reductase n=2 Tax=Actinopolyspora alba group TaxID=2893675 RepID=A0A1I1VGC8_9ACTN|nr:MULTISPECIES: 3-oxoacyl-ACP reductase FabG [Actinopolyspora alba group]MDP9640492.1 3-oxoacyl-[acyl-carrier protein] reductase [Actinopolyspora lacussalsi]SFD79550.1 3-oxoacyl-[acyl-carrier protein] reductase [Actinopolyspora alba]SFT66001.1 3-oxoacyl-[acyl-carrier protein] reductase [Actinopolyspora righensis]